MHISSHPVPQIDRAQQAQGRMAMAGAAALGAAMPTAPIKGPVDIITLSDAAKAAMAQIDKAHGQSAEAPAQISRDQFMAAKIASGAETINIRFGDVVSRIARGISTESLFGSTPDGDEDAAAVAAADGETTTPSATSQDENFVPTEANTAASHVGGASAGETNNIAAVAKSLADIDVLDLLSSDKGESLEVIV